MIWWRLLIVFYISSEDEQNELSFFWAVSNAENYWRPELRRLCEMSLCILYVTLLFFFLSLIACCFFSIVNVLYLKVFLT